MHHHTQLLYSILVLQDALRCFLADLRFLEPIFVNSQSVLLEEGGMRVWLSHPIPSQCIWILTMPFMYVHLSSEKRLSEKKNS